MPASETVCSPPPAEVSGKCSLSLAEDWSSTLPGAGEQPQEARRAFAAILPVVTASAIFK